MVKKTISDHTNESPIDNILSREIGDIDSSSIRKFPNLLITVSGISEFLSCTEPTNQSVPEQSAKVNFLSDLHDSNPNDSSLRLFILGVTKDGQTYYVRRRGIAILDEKRSMQLQIGKGYFDPTEEPFSRISQKWTLGISERKNTENPPVIVSDVSIEDTEILSISNDDILLEVSDTNTPLIPTDKREQFRDGIFSLADHITKRWNEDFTENLPSLVEALSNTLVKTYGKDADNDKLSGESIRIDIIDHSPTISFATAFRDFLEETREGMEEEVSENLTTFLEAIEKSGASSDTEVANEIRGMDPEEMWLTYLNRKTPLGPSFFKRLNSPRIIQQERFDPKAIIITDSQKRGLFPNISEPKSKTGWDSAPDSCLRLGQKPQRSQISSQLAQKISASHLLKAR